MKTQSGAQLTFLQRSGTGVPPVCFSQSQALRPTETHGRDARATIGANSPTTFFERPPFRSAERCQILAGGLSEFAGDTPGGSRKHQAPRRGGRCFLARLCDLCGVVSWVRFSGGGGSPTRRHPRLISGSPAGCVMVAFSVFQICKQVSCALKVGRSLTLPPFSPSPPPREERVGVRRRNGFQIQSPLPSPLPV